MMKMIFGFVVGLLISVGAVWAAEQSYTLRVVSDFEADPAKCAADGGKAAMVADLQPDGYLATDFEPYCLVPVK